MTKTIAHLFWHIIQDEIMCVNYLKETYPKIKKIV